jgi:polyhydroxyalkanoate synthesis regulator phasin
MEGQDLDERLRELDEALLKVMSVIKERILKGEMSREEIVKFLDMLSERIKLLPERVARYERFGSLPFTEKRRVAREISTKVDEALASFREFMSEYLEQTEIEEGDETVH